ncbi:MAG: DUF4340 domain-containing protein [Lysobacterales bacterium]
MKRSFLYLVGLTLAAILIVLYLAPGDGLPGKSSRDTLLLPAIAEQVNDVSRVEIVTAGETVIATLVKTDGAWLVEQMGGYHADWSKLQPLLVALAKARVVEAKTDKPGYYARLGVEDISANDADSVLVRIGVGDQITGVLIGHEAQGRQGQYVRLQDTQGSALVDRVFEVPRETVGWTDSRIIDVNSSEVAEVEIIHPDAERVLVMRISADQTDFDLAGLPQDREIRSSWAVNSLGSVFSMLNMETVRRADDVDWSNAVKLRLLMFSGVELLADLLEQEDTYLLRLQASHPAASVVRGECDISDEQRAIEEQAATDVANRVEDINRKVSGWVYGISKQKFEAMTRTPEDLLKPLDAS